jgi:hypothetical protein
MRLRPLLVAGLALVLGARLAHSAPEPSAPTLVYYNARLALREGRALETVKLWLLRNAVAADSGRISPHDGDFHSLTWAALGELGLCQDGLPKDKDGARLWPVAVHNQVVRTMGRRPRRRTTRPFDALEVGRQQRHVSINDVLSADELATLSLFPGRCLWPPRAALGAFELPTRARLRDRAVMARVLQHLLEKAERTLDPERVRGQAVVAARLFDLDLQLTELAAREAREQARRRARAGRIGGLERPSLEALRDEAPKTTLPPHSTAARVLRQCAGWSAAEWRSLSPDRRRFLYDRAHEVRHELGIDENGLQMVALALLDAAVEDGEGAAATAWIARLHAEGDPALQARVWGGERGQKLLGLGSESGFEEGGLVALHRGVDHIQRGELEAALRALALALRDAPRSAASDEVTRLARRWLAYVSGRFALSEDLITTLQQLVPRRDHAVLIEDLLWRAALRADRESFGRALESAGDRGALARRMVVLTPLAAGDRRGFLRGVERGLAARTSETLRFLDRFVEALEREDAALRRAHLPTVAGLRAPLEALRGADSGRQTRKAEALLGRLQALEEGLVGMPEQAGAAARGRALSPDGELFAGSVRLAPADPLPWPFVVTTPAAPSVFEPIELRPEEWRDADGQWVFGWRLSG